MTKVSSIAITGASTGIGEACVLRFHELGWRVFAGVRREEDGRKLVTKAGERVIPLPIDVTRSDMIAAAADKMTQVVGDAGLQGLVNNAGIAIGGPVEGIRLERLRHQFEVNLFGQVAVTQALMPLLRAGHGRIVNMSSMAGKVSQPLVAPYCGSKHALEAFTDAMREELRPWKIHVAAVEPGVVITPIWEKAERSADQANAEAPPHIAELYGPAIDGFARRLAEATKSGIPASRVADAVEHAITAARPRTRYAVGTDAKIALFLRRRLSDRAFYWLLRKLTGRK